MTEKPLPPPFEEALDSIRNRLPDGLRAPSWGIICGSGLSGLVDHIQDKVILEYNSIPVSRVCTRADEN